MRLAESGDGTIWEVFQNHFIDTVATQAGVPHDFDGAVDFLISDIAC